MKNFFAAVVLLLTAVSLSGCATAPGESGWTLGAITVTHQSYEVTSYGAAAPRGRSMAMTTLPTPLTLFTSVWEMGGGEVSFAPICKFDVQVDERLMELTYVDPNGHVYVDKLDQGQYFHFKKEIVSCDKLRSYVHDPSRRWREGVSSH